MQGVEFTDADKAKFLKKLKLTKCNVAKACQFAGVSRQTAYDHKGKDENFSRIWEEIKEAVADEMEAELFRRAVKGVLKPIFYRGQKVATIREVSDQLLMFALKGNRPEKFRERFDIDQNIKGHLDISIDKQIDDLYGEDDGDKDDK